MISGFAAIRITFQAGWNRPRGRRNTMASSGTKTLSRMTVLEPVARIPSVRQSSASDMPDAANGATKCRTCHPSWGSSNGAEVTSKPPLGEPLANGFLALTRKPAVDARHNAVRFHPVTGAGRDKHDFGRGDLLQQLLTGPAATVIVHRRRHEMLMHRQGQRRRRTIMRQLAQEGAHRAVARAATAELCGNQRGEDPVLLEHLVMFGDEDVACVTLGDALGKPWSDDLRERFQVWASIHNHPPGSGGYETSALARRRSVGIRAG